MWNPLQHRKMFFMKDYNITKIVYFNQFNVKVSTTKATYWTWSEVSNRSIFQNLVKCECTQLNILTDVGRHRALKVWKTIRRYVALGLIAIAIKCLSTSIALITHDIVPQWISITPKGAFMRISIDAACQLVQNQLLWLKILRPRYFSTHAIKLIEFFTNTPN